MAVHTVIWTPTFLRQARRLRLTQEEMDAIVNALSDEPLSGDIMAGTGGARKLRHQGRGGCKSGGYRTIHYFGDDDVPVFLLSVYAKCTKVNLSRAERNELAKILPAVADAYRSNARKMARKLRPDQGRIRT